MQPYDICSILGYAFSMTRLLINIPGIIIMGYMVERLMPKEEPDNIYANLEIAEE